MNRGDKAMLDSSASGGATTAPKAAGKVAALKAWFTSTSKNQPIGQPEHAPHGKNGSVAAELKATAAGPFSYPINKDEKNSARLLPLNSSNADPMHGKAHAKAAAVSSARAKVAAAVANNAAPNATTSNPMQEPLPTPFVGGKKASAVYSKVYKGMNI
jgi:hypothetical protein